MDNLGTLGVQALPPPDSLGMEYPVNGNIEHIFGAGLWVGGLLDTSSVGSGPPLRLVSTAYEGWLGPHHEFHYGPLPGDTIWKSGRGSPEPSGWSDYWGPSFPFNPISDSDFYCLYSDYTTAVPGHVPLNLQVIQSSFAWDDPYAEAVDIIEYRILNTGVRAIDSAYVGLLMDGDVGPTNDPLYFLYNYAGYYPDMYTAYIHNPIDLGSTPAGVALLGASEPLDSLHLTFDWYYGPDSPPTDALRYDVMSSGVTDPDQYPELGDTRFLLSVGPFDLQPITDPDGDTLVIAFAILSGQSLSMIRVHAERALEIYLNRGLPSAVAELSSEVPKECELLQNYPNPFNPSTTIEFSIPRTSFATLKVFNILGEEVELLVSEEFAPGTYTVKWDASGKPSGVYFYRLETGGFVNTGKLLLLR